MGYYNLRHLIKGQYYSSRTIPVEELRRNSMNSLLHILREAQYTETNVFYVTRLYNNTKTIALWQWTDSTSIHVCDFEWGY
jgi:hypothetical protein